MIRKLLPVMFVAVLVPALATGCQRTPDPFAPPVAVSDDLQVLPGQAGPGLVVDPDSPLGDVPRPIGFRTVTGRSTPVTSEGGARRVRHVYQGVGNIGETVAFYRQAMRLRGWQSGGIHSPEEADVIVMRFHKDVEMAEVQVAGTGRVSTVRVDIGPRNGGSNP